MKRSLVYLFGNPGYFAVFFVVAILGLACSS